MNSLSENFSLEELTFSETAVRRRLANAPDETVLRNLKRTARHMEEVRALLGDRPIMVTSGYRSPEVNALVGGAPTSAHTKGWAVDFKCGYGDPYAVCLAISRSGLEYDQLIHEYGAWTHISFDPRARRQNLTAMHGAPIRAGIQRS